MADMAEKENLRSSTSSLVHGTKHVPATTEDMLKGKVTKTTMTLNDYVEQAYIALYSNEEFQKSIDAVWDEDAVEGSLAADNFIASGMIRDWAKTDNNSPYLEGRKLATIAKSLNVVLRRYGLSRKQRRTMLHGEEDAGNGNDE